MAPFFAYKPPGIGYAIPPAGYATAAHTRPRPAPITRGPTYTAGPYGRTVPYDPNLYKTKKPITTPTPTPRAVVDPWTRLYQQLLGTINETPAQQEARVNREIDAQIAAQKKLLDDEYTRQMANAQRMYAAQAAAGSAAAAMSGDLFNAVGGEYNQAASEISGLSHGLTKGVEGATASDTASANAGLAGAGNLPVTTGGGITAVGPAGASQQGVEDYRGGTLGNQLFTGLGQGANFGLAGLANSDNLRATQEANAALMTATHDINDAQSKAISALAAGRTDLFHTYMNDANDAKIKQISLAQGIMASQAAGVTKPFTKMVNGSLMQYDPITGKWKKAVAGTNPATARAAAAAAKAKLPSSALSKIYGHVVDSNGNAILGPDGKLQPIAKTADTAKANLQLSRALGRWVDANGIPIPSLNKAGMPKPPPFFKPGKPGKGNQPTDDQIKTAQGFIHDHQLLLSAEQKLAAYNQRQIAAGVERSKGVKWADNPMTIEQVGNLDPKWLVDMGMTAAEARAAEDPHTLQQVYLDMVHAGVPARRAWQMLRKVYPNFGQGYFT